MITENIKESLNRYVEHHIPTGSFLNAVLSNDLFESFGRADSKNRENLFEICEYIYNEIPSNCWGSKEIVNRWLENKKPEK